MIQAQTVKLVSITPPQAIVDNNSWTTAVVDTLGFDYAKIVVYIGALDIAMAALKVQECDTSGGTYADISGTVFGTATNSAGSTSSLPSATDDNKFFVFYIDLRGGRKRYLDLVATGGDGSTGTYLTAWAELSRGENIPATATDRGVSQEMIV